MKKLIIIVLAAALLASGGMFAAAFTTATTGVHAEGTLYRMDGVPLRTRAILPSKYPNDEVVLSRLLARVTELSAN